MEDITDPWSLDFRPAKSFEGSSSRDLGSVITDCEVKHYNTVDCGIPKWLMVIWIRLTAPRSIVTDHYLLDPEGVLIPDSLGPANNL